MDASRLQNPREILAEAQQAMEAVLDQVTDELVTALARRNYLRGLLEERRSRAGRLAEQAGAALEAGREDEARALLIRKAREEEARSELERERDTAASAASRIKESLRQSEEQVRRRAARQLALATDWTPDEIESQLSRALAEIGRNRFPSADAQIKSLLVQWQTEADVAALLCEATSTE